VLLHRQWDAVLFALKWIQTFSNTGLILFIAQSISFSVMTSGGANLIVFSCVSFASTHEP